MNEHAFELIPLTIEARGEVIASNVEEVREMVREALSNINRDLLTDEDFGQAEKDVKALKGVEERFVSAKEQALKDAEALHQLFAAIDATVEEVRAPRLELEKLIAKRKDEVKSDLIAEAMGKLDCAERLRQPVFGKSVAEAIKGKRTLDSMRKALETIVTIHNGMIGRSRKMIESFAKTHGEALVMDREELETKSPDSVEAELRRRFEAKKATEERKRLEAEAAAARAAEAKAKAEAAKQPEAAPEANIVPMSRANPHNLPEPPKIGGIPTGPSPLAEWTAWLTACKTTFGALKAAKGALKHAENIRRADILAEGVNAAWKAMKEAGEEVAQ